MTTLGSLRDRLEQSLVDTTNVIWPVALLDEAIRQALAEYGAACKVDASAILELEAGGCEISLASLPGLTAVLDAWWPYSPDAELWPPNRLRGYTLWRLAGGVTLVVSPTEGPLPQAGQFIRIWYTLLPCLEGLDSAAATTLPAEHEHLLITGAAGLAAMARVADLTEAENADVYFASMLGVYAKARLREFRHALGELRAAAARSGPGWRHGWPLGEAPGWPLDKWDRR